MRVVHRFFIILGILSLPHSLWAQEGAPKERKQMIASRIPNGEAKIDGRLDEAFWQNVQMVSDFTQKEPNEGEPASERTEIGFVYDDNALYIGARMYSAHPESLRIDVNRRDNPGNCEQMIVSIDSYLDRRTCYDFGVSVAGVRTDRYHSVDDEYDRDPSFDPVWGAQSAIDSLGWTCEMHVPFSQLRFIDKPDQIWGVNMNRWVPARNEDAFWIAVPRNETGWSSWFGELRGISGIKPSRRIELLPYVASNSEFQSEYDPNDPYNDGSELTARTGADVKMGLGPNLTLDATINPDFGQVEADPAEVNLSDFETAFEEKRPFFIEGIDLFEAEGPSYFYSRRVGQSPRGPAGGDYVDYPSNTTILGAAKVTGRTEGGLSIGVLSALTSRESARIRNEDSEEESKVVVEPATGYGVLRLQQEFGEDASTAGLLFTGVQRDLKADDPLAGILRKSAVSGNADWTLRFKGGAYDIVGYTGFSHIEGTKRSILRAQRSSARYYQRPDANHVEIDTNATSMSGYTLGLRGGKRSGEHWLWGGGFSMESPGFELNDAGILGQADDIESWQHVLYREQTPGKLFRRYEIVLSRNSFWNYSMVTKPSNDPSHMLTFFELNMDFTFLNHTGTHLYAGYDFHGKSDNLTRGGPLVGTPKGIFLSAFYRSNFARPTSYDAEVFYMGNDQGGFEYNGEVGFNGRVGNRVSFSVTPGYGREVNARQYITTLEDGRAETYGKRYVFGHIDLTEVSAELRLNYFFSPNLSLECYAEPFSASGKYYGFGELPEPASQELRAYNEEGRTIVETEAGHYEVTDGSDSFEFDAEDFGVRSFRSNVVLKWEFRPGSTMYVVWQQDREGDKKPGLRVKPGSLGESLGVPGANFIALKISYWIPVS